MMEYFKQAGTWLISSELLKMSEHRRFLVTICFRVNGETDFGLATLQGLCLKSMLTSLSKIKKVVSRLPTLWAAVERSNPLLWWGRKSCSLGDVDDGDERST